MQKIKSEKGITLIILVITVIVLAMLSIPVITNVTDVNKRKAYENFCEDITRLNESIMQVYDLKDGLSNDTSNANYIGPIYSVSSLTFLTNNGENIQDGLQVKNPNDGDTYYAISTRAVDNKLKDYGLKIGDLTNGNNSQITSSTEISSGDYYIINAQSRTIYYTAGIQYKGQTYYRYPGSYVNVKVSK